MIATTKLIIIVGSCALIITVLIRLHSYYPYAIESASKPSTRATLAVKQTFVINSDHSKDRLEKMKRQMAFLKVPFYRIRATMGKAVMDLQRLGKNQSMAAKDLLGDVRIKFLPWLHKRGDGEMGCTISHIRALLAAVDHIDTGEALDGPIFVMEDDVLLSADLFSEIDKIIRVMDLYVSNWKVLAMGYCGKDLLEISQDILHRIPKEDAKILATINQVSVKGVGCMHAYILRNRNATQRLLVDINLEVLHSPVDMLWSTSVGSSDFNIYVYKPNNLITQDRRSFRSEVVDGRPLEDWWGPRNAIKLN